MTARAGLATGLAALALCACSGATGTVTVELATAPDSRVLDGVTRLRVTLTTPRKVVEAARSGSGFDLSLEVDASFVGHDLNKGTSSFEKTARATPRDPRENEVVREVLHAYEVDGPQLDSAGEPVTPAA